MIPSTEVRVHRSRWMAPASGALAAILCYAPFLYLKNFDIESILYLLLLAVAFIVFAIIAAIGRIFARRWVGRTTFLTVLAFLAGSALMFIGTDYLRPWARWIIASQRYKDQVMSQMVDPKTGLRFGWWDGWGMLLRIPTSFFFTILQTSLATLFIDTVRADSRHWSSTSGASSGCSEDGTL